MTSTPTPYHLMIPGPTPLPKSVQEAMGQPAIGHRSPEFKAVMERVLPGLQWLFQTKNDVLLLTASGTAAMECAMINTLNAGDRILVMTCGVFSARWADMAELLGVTVDRINVPMGEANTVESLEDALKEKNYKGIVITHSETSTGILNPLKALAKTIRDLQPDALIYVDAVTSLGATSVEVDAWDLDLVISGSQKSFMIPPGLSFLSVSPRALGAHQTCERPGLYFNFKNYQKAQSIFNTPYTPATHLILALDAALTLMKAEGLEQIFQRHETLRNMTRAGVKALDLPCFTKEDTLSSTAVTSVRPPETLSVDDIREGLKREHRIIIANGQKDLKGKIFRIGHLGYQSEDDVINTLNALEKVISGLGHPVTTGSASTAAKNAAKRLVRH